MEKKNLLGDIEEIVKSNEAQILSGNIPLFDTIDPVKILDQYLAMPDFQKLYQEAIHPQTVLYFDSQEQLLSAFRGANFQRIITKIKLATSSKSRVVLSSESALNFYRLFYAGNFERSYPFGLESLGNMSVSDYLVLAPTGKGYMVDTIGECTTSSEHEYFCHKIELQSHFLNLCRGLTFFPELLFSTLNPIYEENLPNYLDKDQLIVSFDRTIIPGWLFRQFINFVEEGICKQWSFRLLESKARAN